MKKTRDLNIVAFAKRKIDLGTRVVVSKKIYSRKRYKNQNLALILSKSFVPEFPS